MKHNLSEKLLEDCLKQCINEPGSQPLWSLSYVPTIGFYRALHHFLKTWSVSSSMTKVDIGRFYIVIDQHLKRKGSRPYSIYRFIENVVTSSKASTDTITYGKDYTMDSLQSEVANLKIKLQEKEDEMKALREEMGVISKDYRKAMETITQMQLQQTRYATKLSENNLACENALLENFHLATLVKDLQKEIETLTHKVDFLCKTEDKNSVAFCFQTMDGGKTYSPAIRLFTTPY